MKTLYIIRHGKSGWSEPQTSDFERTLNKRGQKDLKTMGSYLSLKGLSPDLVLSSCALVAQQTADGLLEKLDFNGEKHYLKELYHASVESTKEIICAQESRIDTMFLVGHNPHLQELLNSLQEEHISKFPSLAIAAIHFDVEEWNEIEKVKGKLDFYIFPKQFQYYMPKQIRATLG